MHMANPEARCGSSSAPMTANATVASALRNAMPVAAHRRDCRSPLPVPLGPAFAAAVDPF